jgi:hypothetical protein
MAARSGLGYGDLYNPSGRTNRAMTLPAHISARICDVIHQGGGMPIDDEARGHGAIALMGTIGAIWMLRPDGTLWDADADFGKPLAPLSEEFRTTAIVYGVERFPWLAELLPTRSLTAKDCTGCAGRGFFETGHTEPPLASRILCQTCHGMGWVGPSNPALTPTGPRPAG